RAPRGSGRALHSGGCGVRCAWRARRSHGSGGAAARRGAVAAEVRRVPVRGGGAGAARHRRRDPPPACAALRQRVTDGGIRSGRPPLLLADAIHATAAALPAGWVWDRKVATPPTHLIAAAAALWALGHNDRGGRAGSY